jgi:catechol 2,3-dioxygenase
MRIAHVGLAVRDLDRALAFYTDLAGLRLTERFAYPDAVTGHGTGVAAAAFLRCDSTHHSLVLFALRGGAAPAAATALGLHHFAFELPTPAELIAKYRALKAAGVPIVNSRIGGPGNQPRFYARDPDGNLVEFYWGIDQIGWDGRTRPYPPIAEIDLERFDFEAFAAERERMAGGPPSGPPTA